MHAQEVIKINYANAIFLNKVEKLQELQNDVIVLRI